MCVGGTYIQWQVKYNVDAYKTYTITCQPVATTYFIISSHLIVLPHVQTKPYSLTLSLNTWLCSNSSNQKPGEQISTIGHIKYTHTEAPHIYMRVSEVARFRVLCVCCRTKRNPEALNGAGARLKSQTKWSCERVFKTFQAHRLCTTLMTHLCLYILPQEYNIYVYIY